MKDLLIFIHYCKPCTNKNIYTAMVEYLKIQKRKQIIKDVLFFSVYMAFVICRAYVFWEYGI